MYLKHFFFLLREVELHTSHLTIRMRVGFLRFFSHKPVAEVARKQSKCPYFRQKGEMTVEKISWSISTKVCAGPGIEPAISDCSVSCANEASITSLKRQ